MIPLVHARHGESSGIVLSGRIRSRCSVFAVQRKRYFDLLMSMRRILIFIVEFSCGVASMDIATAVWSGNFQFVISVFNDSVALHGSPAALQPGGTQAAAAAAEFRSSGRLLVPALSTICQSQRASHVPSKMQRHTLRSTLQQINEQMRVHAAHLADRLRQVDAPAVLVKLITSVAVRTELEGSMSPECRMLSAALAEDGDCSRIINVGLMCLQSLSEGSQRCDTLTDWAFGQEGVGTMTNWKFHTNRGKTRQQGLVSLLQDITHQEHSGGGELRMAEVGVWHADVSSFLLEKFPSLRMILVDPYHLRIGGESGDQAQGFSSDAMDLGTSRTQSFRDRATHMVQGSVEAAAWVARESLDLVFIDGDHSYEGAGGDVAAWWPTLRPGGIMAGHDYTFTWPGVVQAVNEFAISNGIRVDFTPELWFMSKPPT